MDYICAKFGLSCFGLADRQTDRHTVSQTVRQKHRITDADDRYTDTTTVGVSNKKTDRDRVTKTCWTKMRKTYLNIVRYDDDSKQNSFQSMRQKITKNIVKNRSTATITIIV